MNKTETIDTVARSAEISKAVAERVVEAFEARLKAHGDAGARVVIRGFGSFSRGLPSPKAGRNPRTTSRRTSRRWLNQPCAARLPPTRKSAKPPPSARWTPCKPPSPSVCARAAWSASTVSVPVCRRNEYRRVAIILFLEQGLDGLRTVLIVQQYHQFSRTLDALLVIGHELGHDVKA